MKRKSLKSCFQADKMRFIRIPTLKDLLLHNEVYFIYSYIKHLRSIEYHKDRKGFHKIAFLYHWYCYKHLGFKLKMAIYPNTIGPGFRIYHAGAYTHVGPNVKIGENCTFVSGVVFGNKTEKEDNTPVVVGDNCYFGIGVTVLGGVKIGNNVTVGAHAVVTKDIPDNAVVGGIPAKVIIIKN